MVCGTIMPGNYSAIYRMHSYYVLTRYTNAVAQLLMKSEFPINILLLMADAPYLRHLLRSLILPRLL